MTKSSLLRSDSERNFTPPTEFPAEYVDEEGDKAVILGRGPLEGFPFIGYNADGAQSWTECGRMFLGATSPYDLHDITNRLTTWHNVYVEGHVVKHSSREEADEFAGPRLCVYRIERDEDGGNPEIFVEEV